MILSWLERSSYELLKNKDKAVKFGYDDGRLVQVVVRKIKAECVMQYKDWCESIYAALGQHPGFLVF